MSGHQNAPEHPSRSTWNSFSIIITCLGAMILNCAGDTSVAIAVPQMGRQLHIPEDRLQWIVSSFALSSGCLLLVFGRLADIYGRKRMFLAGTFWFLAFTLGCGFVNDQNILFVMRALQGVGIAAAMPAAGGTLAHSFPPSKMRSIAFATFSAGAPIGAAFGMSIGGVLTAKTSESWRAIFYFSACVASLCLMGGYFAFDSDPPLQSLSFLHSFKAKLPAPCKSKEPNGPSGSYPRNESMEDNTSVDWVGAFSVIIGLVLIIYVIGDCGNVPQKWTDQPYVPILFTLGILSLIFFVWWQWYLGKRQVKQSSSEHTYSIALLHSPPLMPLYLWARGKGRYAATMVIVFLNMAGFMGWAFWVQLLYQDYLGLSPLQTVVRLIPMFVTGVLLNIIVAFLVDRVPVVYLISFGTFCTSIACLLLATASSNASYWAYGFPAAILIVFGADFVFASGTLYIAKVSQPHEQSIGAGIFQTMQQVGAALGVTTTTIVYNSVFHRDVVAGLIPMPDFSRGPPAPPRAMLDSFQAAFWLAFAFSMTATLLAVVFFWNVGIVGHKPEKRENRDTEEKTSSEPAPPQQQSRSGSSSSQIREVERDRPEFNHSH